MDTIDDCIKALDKRTQEKNSHLSQSHHYTYDKRYVPDGTPIDFIIMGMNNRDPGGNGGEKEA